jgi:twitching motility protein PilT
MIEQGKAFDMMTFDQSIADLYAAGSITADTAVAYASRRAVVGRSIDTIKSKRGEKTTSIEGLSLDRGYGRGKPKR